MPGGGRAPGERSIPPRATPIAPGETGALVRRVRTSAIFVPILIGIAWPGGWLFAGFISLVSVVALVELAGVVERLGRPMRRSIAAVIGALVPLAFHAGGLPREVGWPALAVVGLAFALRRRGGAMGVTAMTVLGVAYVPVLLGHLVLLRDGDAGAGGREAVLFLFVLTWACDTFAYLIGRAIGRHRLWPRVSPNKTREGALGGVGASLLTALAAQQLFFTSISPGAALVIGLVVSVFLQLGDLFESHLKRKAGIKDSSSVLPGHGGVLDRFDSMLFGAPVLYHVLKLF